MLTVEFQKQPYASGSHISGGRFNPKGTAALYLGADHSTAIAEFHQSLIRPGTLAGYDVAARKIADLTRAETRELFKVTPEQLGCSWRTIFAIDNARPPTWNLADRLIALGAEGALVPSFQRPGGINLVLWRWRRFRARGVGAALKLVDPDRELADQSYNPGSDPR